MLVIGWRVGVSIRRGAVLPTTDGTGLGEEHAMDDTTYVSEPASELAELGPAKPARSSQVWPREVRRLFLLAG